MATERRQPMKIFRFEEADERDDEKPEASAQREVLRHTRLRNAAKRHDDLELYSEASAGELGSEGRTGNDSESFGGLVRGRFQDAEDESCRLAADDVESSRNGEGSRQRAHESW